MEIRVLLFEMGRNFCFLYIMVKWVLLRLSFILLYGVIEINIMRILNIYVLMIILWIVLMLNVCGICWVDKYFFRFIIMRLFSVMVGNINWKYWVILYGYLFWKILNKIWVYNRGRVMLEVKMLDRVKFFRYNFILFRKWLVWNVVLLIFRYRK